MQEFSTTRANHLIDPVLHVWGWEIPVYLFLGGLVAGMMIISGYFLLSGRDEKNRNTVFVNPIIGTILLSLGMLALFLDLENKLYVWRLYTAFRVKSPMSWGAWILLLVYPAMISNIIISLPDQIADKYTFIKRIKDKLSNNLAKKRVGIFNMILGAMLGMYTGVLLSTLGARPLWNTSILWVLFLVSGLSGAAALVHLYSENKDERVLLAKADSGFLTFELFVLVLMFVGLYTSTEVHKHALDLILTGAFAPAFWVFVVFLGIIIPLFLQVLAANGKIKHNPIVPIMVIIGGIILRFVIVQAGQASSWSASLF